MIGIIFAAGIGSRLKPFTDRHPKALAPVAGVPALIRVADKLRDAGARKIIVNVHHFAGQVRECLAHLPYACDIEISDESDLLLDTGGALAAMWRNGEVLRQAPADEDVVVHNADIITDFDIGEFCAARHRSGADAAILVDSARKSMRQFLFDSEMYLRGWENIPKEIVRPAGLNTSGLHEACFGGVHVLSPAFIASLAASAPLPLAPFSIVDVYLDICSSKKIYGYTPATPFRWHDIGTPEKLHAADLAFS